MFPKLDPRNEQSDLFDLQVWLDSKHAVAIYLTEEGAQC